MRWLPTYFLTLALLAFGTLTQGNDGLWWISLFVFAPIAGLSILYIHCRPAATKTGLWLAAGHVGTLTIGVAVLPGYWRRVTLARDHIGAGSNADYIGAFEPARWHWCWAPVMTLLLLGLVSAIFCSLRQMKEV
jgi:hypothetical protein